MTDVRGIIIEFLTANGYDGLADDECGCGIDDLAPCGGTCIPLDCEPAYRWRCAAIGNSMAVNVMRFIGERIEVVEGLSI